MSSPLTRAASFFLADVPSPWIKQLPTTVAFAAGMLIVLFVPGVEYSNHTAALAAVWGIAVATGFAVLVSRVDSLGHLAIIVPAINFLALGAFRYGTGGTSSLFSSLIILPVLWMAVQPGRRYIVFSAIGTSVALMMPYILELSLPSTSQEWLRGVVTPVVFAIAAAIVNEMARQGRAQVDKVQALAEEREKMLRGAEDYTRRLRQNEERLQAADRLTRSVLDSVTEQAVIGSDVTGLIDVWNPGATKMLGPTSTEVQGKRYMHEFHLAAELDQRSKDLNYPPGETVLNPGFSALVESARLGKAEVRQWTYLREDGSSLSVEVAVTRRVSVDGSTAGYIFVATDVTQALEVNRLKDEFVGLISHELRTPLSSILGYLELMRDDEENPLSEEQVQYLGVAERNAHRLLRLVGDLLFTAQVGSSTFSIATTRVDFSAIVRASVESARPVATGAGVVIDVGYPSAPVWVDGDPVRLGQACDNIISNAIKFTPRGGVVSVALTADDKAVLTIADTGIGIPTEELDQLFARFFRASTATRAAVPGVGLGLSITKAIIVAHDGELDVESEVGTGTAFFVRLPIAVPGRVLPG